MGWWSSDTFTLYVLAQACCHHGPLPANQASTGGLHILHHVPYLAVLIRYVVFAPLLLPLCLMHCGAPSPLGITAHLRLYP